MKKYENALTEAEIMNEEYEILNLNNVIMEIELALEDCFIANIVRGENMLILNFANGQKYTVSISENYYI